MLARETVKADLDFAKSDLHPKRQIDFFVEKKKMAAVETGAKVSIFARNNAALIGVAGISALLFAARKPIADLISRLRQDRSDTTSND